MTAGNLFFLSLEIQSRGSIGETFQLKGEWDETSTENPVNHTDIPSQSVSNENLEMWNTLKNQGVNGATFPK